MSNVVANTQGLTGARRLCRTALVAALPLLISTERADAQEQPVGKRVQINGMQMYYEVSGNGDPLIVLHGAYMNIPTMGAIIPKLATTRTVYALELQGHGRTTDIARPITYPNMADDVAAFMDSVGLPKADVFGYSMGAEVGLQLAIRHPAKVNKLVAASVAYDLKGWQPAFTEVIPQMTVEMVNAMPFAKEYPKLAANPSGFPELARKLIALEKEPMAWEADVKALKTPVLVIAGDITHGRHHAGGSASRSHRAVSERENGEGVLRAVVRRRPRRSPIGVRPRLVVSSAVVPTAQCRARVASSGYGRRP